MANRAAIELGAALLTGAVSAAALAEASGYRGASGYMPVAVTAAVLGLSAIWAGQSVLALARGAGGRFDLPRPAVARFCAVVGAAILYVIGIAWIGFFTSTAVMVPTLAIGLGWRGHVTVALATLGFLVVLYSVFRLLLSVPLPPEAVLHLFGA